MFYNYNNMKNTIILFFVVLIFASCEGPRGYDGKNGVDGALFTEVIEFDILSSDWILIGNQNEYGSYYYYEYENISVLDNYVYNKGIVNGFIFWNEGDFWVQKPLPYSIAQNNSNESSKWDETYSFDFREGYIAFIVYYSDFKTERIPANRSFRVTFAW